MRATLLGPEKIFAFASLMKRLSWPISKSTFNFRQQQIVAAVGTLISRQNLLFDQHFQDISKLIWSIPITQRGFRQEKWEKNFFILHWNSNFWHFVHSGRNWFRHWMGATQKRGRSTLKIRRIWAFFLSKSQVRYSSCQQQLVAASTSQLGFAQRGSQKSKRGFLGTNTKANREIQLPKKLPV